MLNLVIDPGHGGWDPGTTGGGMLEKNVQLSVGLQLRDMLLARYLDINVVMTRELDEAVYKGSVNKSGPELQARVNIANQLQDAVLVSCHHDATVDPDSDGATIYVYGPTSYQYAVEANGTINHEAGRSFIAAQLMEPLFKAAIAKWGVRYRGIKTGNFAVLRDTVARAILFEAGFATNSQNAECLRNPNYQRFLAETYCECIGRAFSLQEKPQPVVVPPQPIEDCTLTVILPDGQEIKTTASTIIIK